MGDVGLSAIAAIMFSCLIVAIELTRAMSFSHTAILRGTAFIYFIIIAIGNTFSTFLAATITETQIPNVAPAWFWYAFLGVFGFEAILKNVNLTFSDFGVLSINDWINKAKDMAIADAVEADVLKKEKLAQQLAQKLVSLDESTINAHVINILGQSQLSALDAAARQGSADPKLIKALALAKGNYSSALAILPSPT